MKFNADQFAKDGSIILSICATLGLPIPKPEDMKEEEAIPLMAFGSTYLVKRAISSREDAEYINYLWIETERKMFNHADN